MKRRHLLASIALALTALSIGSAHAQRSDRPLKVGVRGGVDEEIWEVVTRVVDKQGLKVQTIVITGTASPNEALNNGDLDANSFQHIPFLRDQIRQRGYKLVNVGDTLISPIAFYSRKYKSLETLPNGARIGIPNDPSTRRARS